MSSAAQPVRKWQIGVAAGAAALAAFSLWANWPGLRADYWRSRLENEKAPAARYPAVLATIKRRAKVIAGRGGEERAGAVMNRETSWGQETKE